MINISVPKDNIINGTIIIPSSKSISNRALIIKALSKEEIKIENISISEDTNILAKSLKLVKNRNTKHKPIEINVGMAGTTFRFLTAFLSIQKGEYILTGEKRLRERPIKPLVDALIFLGAKIEYLENEGFAPLKIKGNKLVGKEIEIDAKISSQFITALMLIAPKIKNGITINLKGKIASLSYLKMTSILMKHFNVESTFERNKIRIPEQKYKKNKIIVESDWSSASYFYESLALANKGKLILKNYTKNSIQGDSKLVEIYKDFGIHTEFNKDEIILTKKPFIKQKYKYNFISEPDLAQAVLATCVGLNIEAELTGLESLKIKETDRIHALNKEFNKLNWELIETKKEIYSLRKTGSFLPTINLSFNTYNDHRMAMCLAPLVLKHTKTTIHKHDVVRKSNPLFWELLVEIGFGITQ